MNVSEVILHERKVLDGDDETIVWHIVVDLIQWCAKANIDFKDVAADALEYDRQFNG